MKPKSVKPRPHSEKLAELLAQRQRKKPVEKTGREAVVHQKVLGKTFGRLTVIKQEGYYGGMLTARCSCGNLWQDKRYKLLRAQVRSCGCLQREIAGLINLSHGHTTNRLNTKLYAAWGNMKSRCYLDDPINHRYREKGIKVCRRWLKGDKAKGGFECFAEDMGEPPSKDHTIERIDNDGHYEPKNCRWATRKEQANNCCRNVILTFKGETHTIPRWAEITGIDSKKLRARLRAYGWTVQKALTTP
jgi:hypothetical protein